MPAPLYLPRYTVTDYQQWEGDWELWSGVAVAMTPSSFGPHQRIAARLIRLLGNALDEAGCDCDVLHELDWVISNDTVVRPDVVVVCNGVPERYLTASPKFIAEILSPRTEDKDRHAKFQLYEQQGVAYYAIVAPDALVLELYHRGASGRYERLRTAGQVELELSANCRITMNPEEIFR